MQVRTYIIESIITFSHIKVNTTKEVNIPQINSNDTFDINSCFRNIRCCFSIAVKCGN